MDPWQREAFGNAGRRHLREANAAGLHTFFRDKAESVMPRLIAAARQFDVAFVDGDHRFDGVFIDVFFACRLVGPGKLIIVDDAKMPAVRKCAAFFTSSGICAVETRSDLKASEKFTLLRVLPDSDMRPWDHWVEF